MNTIVWTKDLPFSSNKISLFNISLVSLGSSKDVFEASWDRQK